MSAAVVITDNATPWIRRVAKRTHPSRDLNRAAAEGALPVFQRNFVRLAASNRNRFGARSSFWGRMLAGTTATATDSVGIIRMPQEVALRYFGGTVTPKTGKYLTIPARTEAYGKSAREFTDLRFVKFANGTAALVQNEQTTLRRRRTKGADGKFDGGVKLSKGEDVGGMVFYWLVPSATIAPDPDVLPDEDEVLEGAKAGVDAFLEVEERS